jgi:hypothetical protein
MTYGGRQEEISEAEAQNHGMSGDGGPTEGIGTETQSRGETSSQMSRIRTDSQPEAPVM